MKLADLNGIRPKAGDVLGIPTSDTFLRENAILTGVFKENDYLIHCQKHLRPEHFKNENRLIYRAMLALADSQQDISSFGVCDYLGSQKHLDNKNQLDFVTVDYVINLAKGDDNPTGFYNAVGELKEIFQAVEIEKQQSLTHSYVAQAVNGLFKEDENGDKRKPTQEDYEKVKENYELAQIHLDKLRQLSSPIATSDNIYQSQLVAAPSANDEIEPTVYIVDGVLAESSLTAFYGAPGHLKTMLLIDMAVSVALGKRWLGRGDLDIGYNTKKSKVLWLDQDSGKKVVKSRFRAFSVANNVVIPPQDLSILSFPVPSFQADDHESVSQLTELIKTNDYKVVFMDALVNVSGMAGENDPPMKNVMAGLRGIAEGTGAAVVFIHHPTKSDSSILRGHGSINSALDAAYYINRTENILTIKCTKQRHAHVPTFHAQWGYDPHPQYPKELQSASFAGLAEYDVQKIETEQIRELLPMEKAKELILNSGIDGVTQKEIIDMCGQISSKNTAIKAIRQLRVNGDIRIKQDGNKRVHYLVEHDETLF